MDFRYYFLKEGTRIYEKSDLITYFKSNPYIEEQTKGDNRIYLYHHPVLNFEARFIMTSKSCVPHLERLNPNTNNGTEYDTPSPFLCPIV